MATEGEKWMTLGAMLYELGMAMRALEVQGEADQRLMEDLRLSKGLPPLQEIAAVIERERKTA